MTDISDGPISAASKDLYAVAPFASTLANAILRLDDGEGTAIALNGKWGCGKSSIVNLVRNEIETAREARKQAGEPELIVTEFKCWWFRGDEAVTLAFLTHMTKMFETSFKDRAKGIGRTITRHLTSGVGAAAQLAALAALGLTPGAGIAGKAAGDTAAAAVKYLDGFLADDEGLDAAFDKLHDLLADQTTDKKRFLVVIDDIDRLTPDEAVSVFRLVKSVGHLPNVTYLLVFDRELSEVAVAKTYPSENSHFLEKIVQTSFDVPMPLQTDLNAALGAGLGDLFGDMGDQEQHRLLNLFYGVVTRYVMTPRHVTRLLAAMRTRWPAINRNVNPGDVLTLETLRLNERSIYNAIVEHKDEVCGCADRGRSGREPPAWMSDALNKLDSDRRKIADEALTQLFPRLGKMGYSGDVLAVWNKERRVCIEAHLNTYLSAGLSNEALSKAMIDELVAKAGDAEFVKAKLRQAATVTRRNGQSMVPVYIDELRDRAGDVAVGDLERLTRTLFEIFDEIDLEQDLAKGFYAMERTSLRYHWLIRSLTRNRLDLAQRTDLYVAAMEQASFGWLVEFVQSAMGYFAKRDDGRVLDEEDYLVSKEAIPALRARARDALRSKAEDGTLLDHRDLGSLLYLWCEFEGSSDSVRQWTARVIRDEAGLLKLAHALSGDAWSAGMGEHVARKSLTVRLSNDNDIVDTGELRRRLEAFLESGNADADNKTFVTAFLEAWRAETRRADN